MAEAPTAEQFRRAAARYATGVAIVTTCVDGLDHAMTANSFTSVSLDPLLALVCVERDSRFHDAVLGSGTWSVSFLPAGGERIARWFATRGRPLAGQFEGVATVRGANGCLRLADALAGLELRTVQVVGAGDHDIVVGEVTAIDGPTAQRDAAGPTIYFASRFRDLS
jgi:flavin reductase (DIM6/NTAB) family NADH-FMN oxidoreductase RutF